MIPLPIDPLLDDLCASLRDVPSLVLSAPPGAGKTTRVPRALLDQGLADGGSVIVLEPRRLAARLAATRVAEELGEPLGGVVGYVVRFDDKTSARTRIAFVTEGILTRRLLGDPTLSGVSTVILDEFHERHLHGDVALALLRRLQQTTRPDLRVVAMSATLESDKVRAFLDDAPLFVSEGRRFDVAIEHLPRAESRPIEAQVASALERVVREEESGDVLVFLPGSREIHRTIEACAGLARRASLDLLPLHGSLPPAEQDRAVRPSARRKIIVATNVAESSVTIDGVTVVIDSGLVRVASHAPWSGLPTLRIGPISKASATQRAGRAGRTRPGRALRLYTAGDLAARPDHDAPEIARVDLAETALSLLASGVPNLASFAWFEAPPPAALEAAQELLMRLGAVEPSRGGARVTELGRSLLRYPLHPRQARIVVEAARRGVTEDGCALAALLGEREIQRGAKGKEEIGDLLSDLTALDDAEAARLSPPRLLSMGLDPARVTAVDRVRRDLSKRAQREPKASAPRSPAAHEEALRMALLAGFPDRVGRVRRPESKTGRVGMEVVFAAGKTAVLPDSYGMSEGQLVVALDAEERIEGAKKKTFVRRASPVSPDYLLELFFDAVRDTSEASWNADAERVEVWRRLRYEGLILEESKAAVVGEEAAKVLFEAAQRKGLAAFAKEGEVARYCERVSLLRERCPELGLPLFDDATWEKALLSLCEGKRSFEELRHSDPLQALSAALTHEQQRALREHAPERVDLPQGRSLRVAYEPGKPPWVESRLQDFFGMQRGPSVAKGRVPVVLHLLAPNKRAVQVTTDLEGFWQKHYPAIARELRRKYPRHAFPDDPRNAEPPPPRGPRRA